MLVFKKWLIPIELLNLTLSGLILACLLLPKSKSSAEVLGEEKDYRFLESYLNEEMKRERVPGFWFAIVNQEKIIYRKGFGKETAVIRQPVDEKSLLTPASYGKAGILRSRNGDFRWQRGDQDGYCKIMITGVGSQTGFIMIINRQTGMKQAGKLAVKTMNEYWGTDLDPGDFDFM